MLNTLNFVADMTKAGMSESVAKTLANALVTAQDQSLDHLATKQDLAKVEQNLAKVEQNLDKVEQNIVVLRKEQEHLATKQDLAKVELNIVILHKEIEKNTLRINNLTRTNGIFHTLILLLLGVLLSFTLYSEFLTL